MSGEERKNSINFDGAQIQGSFSLEALNRKMKGKYSRRREQASRENILFYERIDKLITIEPSTNLVRL